MKHIEFLGVPGSGTTTLHQHLIAKTGILTLDDAIMSAVRNDGRDRITKAVTWVSRNSSSALWRMAYARSTDRFHSLNRFLVQYPAVFETALALQRARRIRDTRQDLAMGWLMNLAAGFQLASEHLDPTDGLAMDEGFAQRSLALCAFQYSDADSPQLEAYLSSMPRPDLVVVVETPIEICEERLNRRGWSKRLDDLDLTARQRFLEGAACVVANASQWLEESSIPVQRVDGTIETSTTFSHLENLEVF